jgi:methyl-accepting chemotaxis protein
MLFTKKNNVRYLLSRLAVRLAFISRMKVFSQILFIIIVMLAFTMIQGYLSISINNTMLQSSQSLFRVSVNRFGNITIIKTYIEQIEKEYVKVLAGRARIATLINAGDISGLPRISSEMVPAVRYFKDFDSERVQIILDKIQNILDLLAKPVNEDNYSKLLGYTGSIRLLTDEISNNSLNASSEDIGKNSRFSNLSRNVTILITSISAFVAIIIGMILLSSVSRPLKKIAITAKSLATGDLSKMIDSTGCKEATAAVDGLNQAIIGLRELVTKINEQSATILKDSIDLKSATFENNSSAAQVATAMEELSKASSEQAHQVSQAVITIQLLAELVRKVSADTESIAAESRTVAESARAGQKAADDISGEISELSGSINNVAKVINELHETSGEINEFTAVICDIADKTALLALNASIEAARAGEFGKGFGVIAAETGKLAEQSSQSAKNITALIDQMKIRTEQSVSAMQKSTQRVMAGKTLAARAAVTFKEIFEILDRTLDKIETVAESARKMAQSNEEVIEAILLIASIGEENLASTEEVSATAEEQSASIEQVNSLAEKLTRIAENLRESVATFELEKKDS